MLTPTDIAEYGERHVESWLSANSFRCHHQQRSGVKDLEARSEEDSLLVHVETSLAPKAPPALTETAHHSICSRAMMLGFSPWFAQVQISAHGDLLGEIQWTLLK